MKKKFNLLPNLFHLGPKFFYFNCRKHAINSASEVDDLGTNLTQTVQFIYSK